MKADRLSILFVIWLLLVGVGVGMLWHYSNTPGKTEKADVLWPAASALQRVPGKSEVVMFVHPKCPCSRASLNELAQLAARSGENLDVRIVFMDPPEKAKEWLNSDLWGMAAGIPGATVSTDPDGREAGLFHAAISGETFVYDTDGKLRFHGGITSERGHEGDSTGLIAIESFAKTGFCPLTGTPTFGCPLYSPQPAVNQ